jgi:hypothetical protein
LTISATDILVPVCSKMPLLYLLTQKVAQKFGYVLGIKGFTQILMGSFAFVLVLFFAIIFTVSSVQNYKQNISSSSLSS